MSQAEANRPAQSIPELDTAPCGENFLDTTTTITPDTLGQYVLASTDNPVKQGFLQLLEENSGYNHAQNDAVNGFLGIEPQPSSSPSKRFPVWFSRSAATVVLAAPLFIAGVQAMRSQTEATPSLPSHIVMGELSTSTYYDRTTAYPSGLEEVVSQSDALIYPQGNMLTDPEVSSITSSELARSGIRGSELDTTGQMTGLETILHNPRISEGEDPHPNPVNESLIDLSLPTLIAIGLPKSPTGNGIIDIPYVNAHRHLDSEWYEDSHKDLPSVTYDADGNPIIEAFAELRGKENHAG